MHCGNCDKTDGLCYASLPPKVKCTVTGEYHLYSDECTVKQQPIVDTDKTCEKKMESDANDECGAGGKHEWCIASGLNNTSGNECTYFCYEFCSKCGLIKNTVRS